MTQSSNPVAGADLRQHESAPLLDVPESVSGKHWLLSDIDERIALGISQRFGLPEIVGRLLAARGVDFDEVEDYLNPTLKVQLPDPSVLKDMDKAAEKIARAIMAGEPVAVFGDYDVDGATSTALLKRYFRMVGHDIRVYIPDRIDEGYGPNAPAFLQLQEEGHNLILTVDCGVTAYEPLKAAKEAGIEIIVFDHHAAEPDLPEAYAVINPNRVDEDGALGNLAAVGVSFLAIVAINRVLRREGWFQTKGIPEPQLTRLLDLVALGTVCDVVPLTGVNRAFVAQGLRVMAMRQNTGLVALSDVAGIDDAPSTFHAGFLLGPRINAGGRVGEASTGSKLLTTEDASEARALAEKLHAWNNARREIEDEVLQQAIEQVEQGGEPGLAVIAAGEGWHPGVIGIVASRLKERYNRPACVIGFDDNGVGKASGRSVHGVDLGNAVIAARQKGLLLAGGGHKMAAGFSVELPLLGDFHKFLEDHISRQLDGRELVPQLRIDGVLTPRSLNLGLVETIGQLAPFGQGNAEPRFALTDVVIGKADVVGESHVRCFIRDAAGGGNLKGIAFRAVDTPLGAALLKSGGTPMVLAGHLRINRWMGRESVEFQITDAAHSWAK